MKVIITGGGGFLGSQLATKILEKGTLAAPSGEQKTVACFRSGEVRTSPTVTDTP